MRQRRDELPTLGVPLRPDVPQVRPAQWLAAEKRLKTSQMLLRCHTDQGDDETSDDGARSAIRLTQTSELRWRRDLNPRSVLADSRFQGECIRPLCHATVIQRSGRVDVRAG